MSATVIYGPPGTGKTTALKDIIAREAASGADITVLSYTKAAAQEISARARKSLEGDVPGTIQRASTIHSLAFALGQCKMASTVDARKLEELTKITGIAFSGRSITEDDDINELEVGDEYMSIYALARAQKRAYCNCYDESHRPGDAYQFAYFCDAYDSWKASNGYYDFSDMLTMAVGVPYVTPVLVVDEAQDLSPAQWELVRGWAATAERVYLAGDDDQAIYVWSGADPQGMADFERDFGATRVILDQSYRIPQAVHKMAVDIITPVENRVAKVYRPRAEAGTIERCDSPMDVTISPDESTLILYRNHSLRGDMVDYLIANEIPHVLDNGGYGVLQSLVAKTVHEWESRTPWSMVPPFVKRYLNRIYSDKQVRDFEITDSWPGDPLASPRISWKLRATLSAYRKNGVLPRPEDCRVHLSSIHGAKGREADHVILINAMTGRTALSYETDRDEESRVFYVGVTRARHKLTIVTGENAINIL